MKRIHTPKDKPDPEAVRVYRAVPIGEGAVEVAVAQMNRIGWVVVGEPDVFESDPHHTNVLVRMWAIPRPTEEDAA